MRTWAPLALGLLCLLAAPAAAEQSRSQRFFADRLVKDRATSAQVRALLRDGGGFVDRSIAFRDLTGDRKTDAIVRVQTGGASGAVAIYVFSTDGAKELRPIFRSQNLMRASTSVRKGVLSYRTSRHAPADPIESPSRVVQTTLRWDEDQRRLRVAEREEITPAPPA